MLWQCFPTADPIPGLMPQCTTRHPLPPEAVTYISRPLAFQFDAPFFSGGFQRWQTLVLHFAVFFLKGHGSGRAHGLTEPRLQKALDLPQVLHRICNPLANVPCALECLSALNLGNWILLPHFTSEITSDEGEDVHLYVQQLGRKRLVPQTPPPTAQHRGLE